MKKGSLSIVLQDIDICHFSKWDIKELKKRISHFEIFLYSDQLQNATIGILFNHSPIKPVANRIRQITAIYYDPNRDFFAERQLLSMLNGEFQETTLVRPNGQELARSSMSPLQKIYLFKFQDIKLIDLRFMKCSKKFQKSVRRKHILAYQKLMLERI